MVLSNGFFYERIQLDTINERFNKVPTAKEGDANGRGMIVVLTENGLVKNTTGVSLLFKWEHTRITGAQGLEDFEPLDLTKGDYIVTYPTEMNHEGYVKAEIRIIDNGKYAGSRNMKIQVEPSVGDDTAMESSNQFSALVTALLQVNSWNTTIDGKIVEWEADMEATKQLYIDTMNDVEATYPQELLSLGSQLADIENTKAEKDEVFSMANMGADIRSAMTAIEAVKLLTGDGSLTYWQTVKGGYYYAVLGSVTEQPSPSGLVQVIRVGTDFSVLWHDRTSQNVYRLYGSATVLSGWSLISGTPVTFAPTLLSGWVNYGDVFAAAGYCKGPDNRVHLQGLITSGTVADGTVIFTLPEVFRPLKQETFIVFISGGGYGRVDVNDNGNVVAKIVNATYTSLSGISFLAKN